MNLARRVLYALAISLGLFSCAYIGKNYKTEPPKSSTFEYACYNIEKMYPEASCDDLVPPIVVETLLVESYDELFYVVQGFYIYDDRYIFIRRGLDYLDKRATVIHETVHYILYELYLVDNDDVCEHERVARLIAGDDWSERTRELYECPADQKE